jgi:hypothetical protein
MSIICAVPQLLVTLYHIVQHCCGCCCCYVPHEYSPGAAKPPLTVLEPAVQLPLHCCGCLAAVVGHHEVQEGGVAHDLRNRQHKSQRHHSTLWGTQG